MSSPVLALPVLYNAVVASFAAAAAAASPPYEPPPQPFGWRKPTERSASFRIVWVPGDEGDVGTLEAVRQPGGNPRGLANLSELFTVYLEARDASSPKDELAQYTAARLLLDAWWPAVYLAMPGVVAVRSIRWMGVGGGPLGAVSQAGAVIRVLCSIQAVIPDAPLTLAATDTSASVATTAVVDGSHDQTDTETVAPGDTP